MPRTVHAGGSHCAGQRLPRSYGCRSRAIRDHQHRVEGPRRRRCGLHPTRRAIVCSPSQIAARFCRIVQRHREWCERARRPASMFGNFVGRPVAKRTYAPLFPHVLDTRTDELALEFANRELFEIEIGRQVAEAGKTLAAGLIDVKNYYIETPEDVAQRIRTALKYLPADQLAIVPDCGFSQPARWASRAKLRAMVEGAKIVRGEL